MMYIDEGDYSAEYFVRAETALVATGQNPIATIQVFQKEHSILAGVNEAIKIIRNACPATPLEIKSLKDGDTVEPWETVMHITGPLAEIIYLESVYLGVMARGTRVASNMRRVVDAAGTKPVLFMGDRFDRYENQKSDGYSALLGGASAICTPAMGYRTGAKAKGTMPHALIAAFGGDVVAAARALQVAYPGDPVSALVDFNNDCVGDSLRCLEAFGKHLASVRLDTSEKMVDKYLDPNKPDSNGVNPRLVNAVRYHLDLNDGQHVKIVVSGGFTPEKIARFEADNVPVDMYGVGSSIIKNGPDFTADVVLVNGLPMAKVGRQFNPNPRLVEV